MADPKKLGRGHGGLSPDVQAERDRWDWHGLLPDGFQPQGDTDREKIASIRARGSVELSRREARTGGGMVDPAILRNFLAEVGAAPAIERRPDPVLPRGDAWEEPT